MFGVNKKNFGVNFQRDNTYEVKEILGVPKWNGVRAPWETEVPPWHTQY